MRNKKEAATVREKIVKLRRQGKSLDEIARLTGLSSKQAVKHYLPNRAGFCGQCQRRFEK